MAHFAKLDENNFVAQVLTVNNDILVDEEGQEQESIGVDFLNSLFGESNWKQCSYNGNIRGRYPGVGSEFIPEIDVFGEIPPYPSWTLNRSTGYCEAPVAKPDYDETTHYLVWNEETVQWDVFEIPQETTTT